MVAGTLVDERERLARRGDARPRSTACSRRSYRRTRRSVGRHGKRSVASVRGPASTGRTAGSVGHGAVSYSFPGEAERRPDAAVGRSAPDGRRHRHRVAGLDGRRRRNAPVVARLRRRRHRDRLDGPVPAGDGAERPAERPDRRIADRILPVYALGRGTSVPDAVERRMETPAVRPPRTARDGRPHVAPVWYAYEDGSLWPFTGGRELRNLRANGRVAASIERGDSEGSVDWQVTLLGTARIVDDDDRAAAVRAALADKYGYGDADDEAGDAGDGGSGGEAGGEGDGGSDDGGGDDGSDGGGDGGGRGCARRDRRRERVAERVLTRGPRTTATAARRSGSPPSVGETAISVN